MDNQIKKIVIGIQKEEIEGHHIYNKLSKLIKSEENAKILREIAKNELDHYKVLKSYTNTEVKPSKTRIFLYILMAKILGLTFSLKLMEQAEHNAEKTYSSIGSHIPEVETILREEDSHENKLLNMINEDRLNYIGSIVLGLNDALIELTGALAGFTFAIQKSRTIALMGLITGVAATLSMAASEFLSQSHEDDSSGDINPLKSSLFTGIAYVLTVVMLVLPYFIFSDPFLSLGIMIATVLFIITCFTFYISIAKNQPFKTKFLEMALISIGVAIISFGIGWLVREHLGFEI